MSEVCVTIDGLGKRYRIGANVVPNGRLTETLWEGIRSPLRLFREQRAHSDIWALKNISLEINEGEVVGIIGRNGSGKTTLLKILSRITAPTEGVAQLRGRVGSLLEVGTGFHPDLTGKENIFLNGAILGMRRAETKRKFDEIVEFAGVEQFLDTPVKRYSTGMHVRLAFSVAAHLEPEVLIVDEVLSVGDAAFQAKSIGKMGEVAQQGRTVLFVSHNLGILNQIATKGIWLDGGEVRFNGDVNEATSAYLQNGESGQENVVDLVAHPGRVRGMKPFLQKATIKASSGQSTSHFSQLDGIVLELQYCASFGANLTGAGFHIKTITGIKVAGFSTYMQDTSEQLALQATVTFAFQASQLTPGAYMVTPFVSSHPSVMEDQVENALVFTVYPGDIYGTGYMLTPQEGVMALSARATIEPLRRSQKDSPAR